MSSQINLRVMRAHLKNCHALVDFILYNPNDITHIWEKTSVYSVHLIK